MIARNAVAPAGRRIEFRVGINVGDIIIENGDIFGDGVNIAARLEAAGGAGRDLPQRRGARAMPRPPISRALNRNWLKNRTFFNEFGPRNHLSLDRRENQPLAAQSPIENTNMQVTQLWFVAKVAIALRPIIGLGTADLIRWLLRRAGWQRKGGRSHCRKMPLLVQR